MDLGDPRRWPPDEERFVRVHVAMGDMTVLQMSLILKRSVKAVEAKIWREGWIRES